MDDLIAKLEAAEGGSRELDGQIHESIGKCPHWEIEWFAYQDDTGFQCKACRKSYVHTTGSDCPHYTTSLDAALTLYAIVPKVIPTDPRLACIEALRQR